MMSNASANSQRVQIRQQIVNLLLTEDLGEARHLVAPQTHDVRDPIVICRHPAHR